MPTAEEIKQLQALLPQISLATFTKYLKTGKLHDLVQLMEEIWLKQRANEGIENAGHQPITFPDVLSLLVMLDWFAPSGEFIPPPGSWVQNINEYPVIEVSGQYCLDFCAREGETGKLKTFVVDPANQTAKTDGLIEQNFVVSDEIRDLKYQAPIDCCRPGSFSTVENITIFGGTCYRLTISNLNTASKAEFHITGTFWKTPYSKP